MESSNSNSKERELQLTQRLAKQRPSHCMAWFEQLETHLRDLYLNSSSHDVDAFKPAFHSFFGEEHQTFRLKMFHNLDQLRLQLERDNLLEVNLNTDVKALDVGSVITESSRTKSDKHDTSNSSGTYITHDVDADTRPVNDQVPFAEVQLTTQHNVFANVQQHTKQSEPIYDTHLLEKVDSNTTPDLTNMCHKGGDIDQDAEQYQAKSPLLKAELVKSKEMIEKETYNELSRDDDNFLFTVRGLPRPVSWLAVA
ncbi:hypothetical protein Tco_1569368 [Tanacetum coccineum]